MASIAISAVINSVAFAGAGLLFSKLNHTGYEAEIKRHNTALEDLAKAKEKWYENEISRKDRINELRQQLSDANHDINDTNKALDELRKVQTVVWEGRTFTREPALGDYYKPSDEMKKYQNIVVGGIGLGGGWALSKLLL